MDRERVRAGGAVTTFELPDESVSVADDVRGGFGIGLGVAVAGLGVALFGWVTFRGTAYAALGRRGGRDEDDEEQQETTPVRGGAP